MHKEFHFFFCKTASIVRRIPLDLASMTDKLIRVLNFLGRENIRLYLSNSDPR
jgi:hypothetical protein